MDDDRSSEFRVSVVVLMVFSDGVGTIVSVCGDRSVKLLQRRLGLMATTGDCMGDDLHRLLVSVSRIDCGKGCTHCVDTPCQLRVASVLHTMACT